MEEIKFNCQKHRYIYLDTIAGLMIVFMIFGHCAQMAQEQDNILYTYSSKFLYFFMAWFFYKSGMFHRIESTLTIVQKSAKRLIKPFVVYSIIGQIINNIYLFFIVHDNNWIHYILSPVKHIFMYEAVEWNMPLWFLLTLFCVKCIFNKLAKYIRPIGCVGISLFISYVLKQTELNTPVIIYNLWISLFFYSLGFYVKNKELTNGIVLVVGGFYLLSIIYPSFVDIRTNRVFTGQYICWIIYCVCAILFFNRLFFLICKTENVLSSIGENSMFLFCAHWIFLKFIQCIMDVYHIELTFTRILPYFIFSLGIPLCLIGINVLIKLKVWKLY